MSDEKTVAPYGSWKSPISSELVAYRTGGMWPAFWACSEIVLDGEDVYWLEPRSSEGRNVVVRLGGFAIDRNRC
mgnify:CR=1 FL=1|jgi:hypothetical protein